jgi:thymidylate kinase
VFVLDVDPGLALDRQDSPDRIGKEGLDFQSAVRSCYHDLAESDHKVVLLDGSRSVDGLVATILGMVR